MCFAACFVLCVYVISVLVLWTFVSMFPPYFTVFLLCVVESVLFLQCLAVIIVVFLLHFNREIGSIRTYATGGPLLEYTVQVPSQCGAETFFECANATLLLPIQKPAF